MNDLFELTTRPDSGLFTKKNDSDETTLGDIVSTKKDDYQNSDIIILGLQANRSGDSDFDPGSIRREFFNLTNFGIHKRIFDLGNIELRENSETAFEDFQKISEQILNDQKRLIVLAEKTGVSYRSGNAMANVFGRDRWLAINIDSHLDTSFSKQINDTTFRRLLNEEIILPNYFYEIGFQPYFCSPSFYRFLQNHGIKMVSLEQIRSRETADLELRELIRQEFIHHSRSMSIFFNFSMNSVRASDAPGVSNSSPFGLRAGEFLTLVQFAARLVNTKIIQFTELDSASDIENRTAKLISIAMHRFCSTVAES